MLNVLNVVYKWTVLQIKALMLWGCGDEEGMGTRLDLLNLKFLGKINV